MTPEETAIAEMIAILKVLTRAMKEVDGCWVAWPDDAEAAHTRACELIKESDNV